MDASLVRPDDREAHREQVWAAATHEYHRLQQGFPEQLIFTEHHLLRRALRRVIEEFHNDSPFRFEAVARLDSIATLATVAALEQRGEWPEAVERLVAEEFRLFQRSGIARGA